MKIFSSVYSCQLFLISFASLLFIAVCKASSGNHFAYFHFFFLGMVLITSFCTMSWTSVHGVLQARILEWIAISFSRGSSWPRDWTQVSHTAGRCFNLCATREAPCIKKLTWFFKSHQTWVLLEIVQCFYGRAFVPSVLALFPKVSVFYVFLFFLTRNL